MQRAEIRKWEWEGFGGEKHLRMLSRGFDSDRHRVMLVAL